MRAHAVKDFGDPPPAEWDTPYQRDLHGMLLLADSNPDLLMRAADEAVDLLEPTCIVEGTEVGHAIRNAAGQGIEHFGFVDGRSQPLFLAKDFDHPKRRLADATQEQINRWDPFERLNRVLVPDPAMNDATCFGSFLVFRKLEQNVRGFRSRLASLAEELGLHGVDAARAGAMVVGRFEDGTPLELRDRAGWNPPNPNNFNYETDVAGTRCPMHAHIRKVNPRGHTLTSGAPADQERIRRITRRSLTYGDHVPVSGPLSALPEANVGVLFMCFQASIRQQFAFMQSQWINSSHFPQAYVGVDALVGQTTKAAERQHAWAKGYTEEPTQLASMAPFVTMKGGAYFFAPSLPFFANL
jgi:Dyp-type peroxidase family